MERTCNRCGWVHVGVSRAEAESEVASFNAFFDAASQDTRHNFGNRRSSITDYERCFHCGGPYTDFRNAIDGDRPAGCTLQPIIV